LKKYKNSSVIQLRSFALILVVLLTAACATVPKTTAQMDTGDFSLLPAGGAMYLWADMAEARPLLESISFDGLDLKQAGSILDRTGSAAAVFSGAGSDRFFVSLRGKYPVFQAGFSMTFSKDWKKIKSSTGPSYWHSDKFNVGVALDSQRALVCTADPFEKLPSADRPAVDVPLDFEDFRTGSVMSGWITDPKTSVNKFLSTMGIPIQLPAEDFFFKVLKSGDDQWELVFRVRTASVNQARALVAIFTLARVFVSGSGGSGDGAKTIYDFLPALFYNLPQRNEDVLTLTSDNFTAKDMSLLFNAISVYSD